MKKKTKLILAAIVAFIFVMLCCSCAVPVPLMIPIVDTPAPPIVSEYKLI